MKQLVAAICVLGFAVFSASAHALPDEKSSVGAVFDNAAEEAVHLSEILREVADTLSEDEELSVEGDAYFFRRLWNKTMEAVKNATAKVKVSVKGAYQEAKDHFKKAAKEAQDKLKEKATQIMSKILGRLAGDYALQDSEPRPNFVKLFVDIIKSAAREFLKLGKALGKVEN